MVTVDPLSNPELLETMRNATERGTSDGSAAVGSTLLAATVLAPGLQSGEDGEVWPAGLARPDQSWDFVCFTDLDAARAWSPDQEPWVGAIGSELIDYVLANDGARLLVNPAGPYAGALSRDQLRQLAAHPRERDVGALSVLSEPLDKRLEARLASLVSEISGLRAVYLLEGVSTGARSHPVVGLALDDQADPDEVVAAIGHAIRPLLPAGRPLDVMPLSERTRAEVERLGPPLAASVEATTSARPR